MKTNKNEWIVGGTLSVRMIGECTAYRRMVDEEYYQWKIVHGFTVIIGDYFPSNADALNDAVNKLKKSILK